jgi:hypothetical protein
MVKVMILGRWLSPQEIAALLALIAESGLGNGAVEVVETIVAVTEDLDDAIVLVMGTADACGDSDLEAILAQAPATGQRAIWIWPKGSTKSAPPPAAKKYCYSIVSWDAKKLAAVMADDDVTCFEYASAEPIPKVETERNCCVDEDEAKGQ